MKMNKEELIKQYPVKYLRGCFMNLNVRLKAFGRDSCKWHRNKKHPGRKHGMQCFHPAMGYGGITRDTDCRLVNCPRIIDGDEG